MAKKRFTDIEIWDREWFMELTPTHKCLIRYIFDKCDASGCWKPNWRLASLHINDDVTILDLKFIPKNQYEILPTGKIFIPDFIKFQYGELSKECRPHVPIIKLIDSNEIFEKVNHLIQQNGTSVKALRKRLTDNAKKEIFEQDDYQCQYCGIRPGIDLLRIDHIIALCENGDNSLDNLTTSCISCNAKKHDDDVLEFIKKHSLTPLNNLSNKLKRVFNFTGNLKEKEKEKEKDKEEEKDMDKDKEKGDFWFLKYYHSTYENYKNIFNGQSTSEIFFIQWKSFIDFIYKKKYEEIFKCKFLSPHDFAKLVVENNFTEDNWEAPIKKILSTGIKPEHNLFFRIPEFIKYSKKEDGTDKNNIASRSTRQQIGADQLLKSIVNDIDNRRKKNT